MEHKLRTDEIWQDGHIAFQKTQNARKLTLETIHASREGVWGSIQEIRKASNDAQNRQYEKS